MIGHVLDAVAALEPRRVVAVVGNQREQVGPHIQELLPEAVLAVQETQDGTGHAVRIAWEALDPARPQRHRPRGVRRHAAPRG